MMMMKKKLLSSILIASLLLAPLPAQAFFSIASVTENGSTNLVTIPFGYLNQSDITVTVNGVPTTAFSFVTSSEIQLSASAASLSGSVVTVSRHTNITSADITFQSGSLAPNDLNTNALQALYAIQEADDATSMVVISGVAGVAVLTSPDNSLLVTPTTGAVHATINSPPAVNAVTAAGWASDGSDNSPRVSALMNAIGPINSGADVVIPPVLGQARTYYHFKQPLDITRAGTFKCPDGGGLRALNTFLVFDAGIDGVIQDSSGTSPDGGQGNGSIKGCGITSLGWGQANSFIAGNNVTILGMPAYGAIPASVWHAGDGLILLSPINGDFGFAGLYVPTGAFIDSVSGGNSLTVNAAFPVKPIHTSFTASIAAGTPGVLTITAMLSPTLVIPGEAINQLTGAGVVAGDYPVTQTSGPTDCGTLGVPPCVFTLHSNYASPVASETMQQGLIQDGPDIVYQLPVSQVFSVTTTTGSPTFTVTSGPRLLQPGDLVWSDAFPFGSTVVTSSGTVGAQTVTMTGQFNDGAAQNAIVTHASGSGKLWIVPEGIKRRTSSRSADDYVLGFPIGFGMECSDRTSPSLNCTGSYDERNGYEGSLFGYFDSGNNTSGSSRLGDVFAHNYINDIFTGSELGILFVGENTNSAEEGAAMSAIEGNCQNENASVFLAGYYDPGFGYCNVNGLLGQPNFVRNVGGAALFLGNIAGIPGDSPGIDSGNMQGPWEFTPNGGLGGNGPCAKFSNITAGTVFIEQWTATCGTPSSLRLFWNASNNTMDLGPDYIAQSFISFPSVDSYTGHSDDPVFHTGLTIGLSQSDAPGVERYLWATTALPTTTWVGGALAQGDLALNHSAVAGGPAGWVDVAAGANAHAFGLIAMDQAGVVWGSLPVAIASLPACAAGMLGEAWVNNGIASPTYHGAVSTTGAATEPVACVFNGTTFAWLYD